MISQRLKRNWGIVDVHDAAFAAKAMARPPYSFIDHNRTVIRGGSAGGFTVLAVLSDSQYSTSFAAGTSLYGISDFQKLAQHTHKYELRYLEGLLGGNPSDIPQVYIDRSPIFHAERIVRPLLVSRLLYARVSNPFE